MIMTTDAVRLTSARGRWIMVVLFSAAMAYVESAVVAYLRVWLDRVNPYQVHPLLGPDWVGHAEILREAATLVMLFAVGSLAGRTWRQRCGYMLLAFGVWDILYYMFLIPLTGWPGSVFDWDVLFLIPLPWWGPVWSPVSIAVLMIVGGTLLSQTEDGPVEYWPRPHAWVAGSVGLCLALYVFMADAIRLVPEGDAALRTMLPAWFNWPLFLLAWTLLAAPLFDVALQWLEVRGSKFDASEARMPET
jgi:hypothetical protein